MDEPETKMCSNCKREIPAANYTIHAVHCSRNIKMCPVCKEPVPNTELDAHHEKMHKLLPCSKCGENVCGSDLEDHVRDSCAHTVQTCKFCELELARGDLPLHENYCGVRTEQCSDCRQWVMIKYRQLHLDSNHGFVRLDEDPAPVAKKEKFSRVLKPLNELGLSNSSALNRPSTSFPNGFRNGPIRGIPSPSERNVAVNTRITFENRAGSSRGNGRSQEAQRLVVKRTNDQPQINTNVQAPKNAAKTLFRNSDGSVKKRQAPAPPEFFRCESQNRREDTALRHLRSVHDLANATPPILSPAERREMQRRMQALKKQAADAKVKSSEASTREDVSASTSRDIGDDDSLNLNVRNRNANGSDNQEGAQRTPDREEESEFEEDPPQARRVQNNSPDLSWPRNFNILTPMSPEQFFLRFTELQLGGSDQTLEEQPGRSNDRFNEIKSSLRALRRGLNEVTAPFNSNAAHNDSAASAAPQGQMDLDSDFDNEMARDEAEDEANEEEGAGGWQSDSETVKLPCEFCERPQRLTDLVLHQTRCRPDLTQFFQPDRQPVIPCEFCAQSLPVYLIADHQERCSRDPLAHQPFCPLD